MAEQQSKVVVDGQDGTDASALIWGTAILCGVFPEIPPATDAARDHNTPIVSVGAGRVLVERMAAALTDLLREDPGAMLSLLSVRVPAGEYLKRSPLYLCEEVPAGQSRVAITGLLSVVSGMLANAGLPILAMHRDERGAVLGFVAWDPGRLVHTDAEASHLDGLPAERRVFVTVKPSGLPGSGPMLWDGSLSAGDFVERWVSRTAISLGVPRESCVWVVTDPSGVVITTGRSTWDADIAGWRRVEDWTADQKHEVQ